MEIIWYILGGFSILLLVIYFNSRNAVWGGLTIGIVIGLLVALIFGEGFNWELGLKIIIISILVGFGAEMISKISRSKQ